jgi:hypothetical protein
MGGAFTGVADSVDAVYWNPAGLAQPEVSGLNSTFVTNWHDSNYDIYVAGGFRPKYGGLGLAYVYNKDYLVKLVFVGGEELGWITQDWHYLQLSYGAYLIKDWNIALGMTVKGIYSEFEIDVENEAKYGGDEQIDDDGTYESDVGIHWAFGPNVAKYKMFAVGCLVQNIWESELRFKEIGVTQKFLINVRPGLSFRPDKMSIISLEVYDATTEYFDDSQIRIGAERWFGFGKGRKILALRAGGYHVNEKEMRAYTGGLGWQPAEGIELAYTLMHWDTVNENTHFVSLNFRGF